MSFELLEKSNPLAQSSGRKKSPGILSRTSEGDQKCLIMTSYWLQGRGSAGRTSVLSRIQASAAHLSPGRAWVSAVASKPEPSSSDIFLSPPCPFQPLSEADGKVAWGWGGTHFDNGATLVRMLWASELSQNRHILIGKLSEFHAALNLAP